MTAIDDRDRTATFRLDQDPDWELLMDGEKKKTEGGGVVAEMSYSHIMAIYYYVAIHMAGLLTGSIHSIVPF